MPGIEGVRAKVVAETSALEYWMEATLNLTKDKGTYYPIGSKYPQITNGVHKIEGNLKKAWGAADGELTQDLYDWFNGDEAKTLEFSDEGGNYLFTASGCQLLTCNIGVSAGGNEPIPIDCNFIGTGWNYTE